MRATRSDGWKPILKDKQAKQAWDAIYDVASIIADSEITSTDCSLSSGYTGYALLFGYLAHITGDEQYLRVCEKFQMQATELLVSELIGSSLFVGFTGVGWGVTHLRNLLDPKSEDPASAIDEVLVNFLSRTNWDSHYDLVFGLVGYAVYGIERADIGQGRKILALVVKHLQHLAVQNTEGLTWHTPIQFLPEWQRNMAPSGYIDLGLAHGIPGVLAVLAKAMQMDVEKETASHLLDKGLRWILALRNIEHGSETEITSQRLPKGDRVAWCYGDLGLSVALLSAVRDADRRALEPDVLKIAESTANRPRATSGVKDAGLCHGTAGNALLYMRLYHATGKLVFLNAALDYINWTFDLRDPKKGFGGFPQYHLDENLQQPQLHYGLGLLEGSTGVALALLASVSDVPPDWDRHLLISLNPRGTVS